MSMNNLENLSRRTVMKGLLGSGCVAAAASLPVTSQAAESAAATAIAAAADSDLIYITALQSGSSEGRRQAEVWFVPSGGDFVVVTAADSWRVAHAKAGQQARIWVGDVGEWHKSDGAYRKLPALTASAAVVSDEQAQASALELLGRKYRMSWLVWGPRFRNGLADGSRVMLRYRPQV